MSNSKNPKYYIHVPYAQKDEAKQNKAPGVQWCPEVKKWYVTDSENILLEKYQMLYLNVKYDDKDEAKSLGCMYDSTLKQWYTTPNNDEAIRRFF